MGQGYRWNQFRLQKGFRLQRKGRAILFTPIDLVFRADFEAMVNVILFLASGMQLPHPDADEAESMLYKCSQNHDLRHLTCSLFVISFIP
ncbi:MAG: hypothetical protein KGN80_06640, partial [Acidobacteriota bacterium]|nr:hypothetical protein [Acidobacteriota bacterium]